MKRALFMIVALGLSSPTLAQDVATDPNHKITAGTTSGRVAVIPYAGNWFPQSSAQMSRGYKQGVASNYNWNATTKQYEPSFPANLDDAAPFVKFDAAVERKYGTNPKSAEYELKNDDANDFDHHVDPDEAAKYQADGIGFGWWGHCNGWAAAAICEDEPHSPIVVQGIRFDVGDLKALQAEVYFGVQSEFTGRRYNNPAWREELHTRALDLLAALQAGTPKPAADYVQWKEDLYNKWYGVTTYQFDNETTPSTHKSLLEWFRDYYKERYTDAYADVVPHVFDNVIVTNIGTHKRGIVADMDCGPEVWNFPLDEYNRVVTFKENLTGGKKRYSVTMTVSYQSDGVDHSILGARGHEETYTYEIDTDANDKPLESRWTGESVDTHPDFVWRPTFNPLGPDTGENKQVEFGKMIELGLVSKDHVTSDARILTFSVNGNTSDSRKANSRLARTLGNPLAATGTLTLTSNVLGGHNVDKVSYYRQGITRIDSESYKANFAQLVHIGDGTGADHSFSYTTTDRQVIMFVARAFAGSTLVSQDEFAVDYTPGSGGTTPPTSSDDQFEENDTRTTAKLIAANTYPNLKCNDADWYRVEVPANGSLDVKITFQHSTGDIDMVVTNASGSTIGSSTSTANQEQVAKTGLAAGSYYVHVYGYQNAKAPYQLVLTVSAPTTGGGPTTPPTSGDDQFEENDTQATAKSVNLGRTTGLKGNDNDWFKFNVTAGQNLTIKIEFAHAESDLDLYLVDANGTELGRSWTTTDNEQIQYKATTTGTLFVRIEKYEGNGASYVLSIQ